MATVTSASTGVKFTLELDEAEAQYVHAALIDASPAKLDGGDRVYRALDSAMIDAGVESDYPDALTDPKG